MISIKPLFGYLAYHNITLKELAEKSGAGYQTLIAMEKTGRFTPAVMDKIYQALNVNIKDVMRYE